MDVRVFGLENPVLSTLHRLMDTSDEMEKGMGAPTRTYVQDARAMASTPADVKELPSAYAFIVDMPGIKPADIKVQVEDDRILVISGERTRGSPGEEDGGKYLRLERRVGKFMRKFALPDNANADAISAVCQNGVLTVTVQKVPPPEPKKPKTVEVLFAPARPSSSKYGFFMAANSLMTSPIFILSSIDSFVHLTPIMSNEELPFQRNEED